jgi:tetratricopeptide (TPR) repeat protein
MTNSDYKTIWDEGVELVSSHLRIQGRPTVPLDNSQVDDLERALVIFKRASAAAPANPAPLLMLGKIEQRLARYDRSAEWLTLADALQPNHPTIALELGLAYGMLRRYKDSAAVLAKAAMNNPNDVNLHFNLAISLLLAGQADDAAQFFDRVSKLEPSETNARLRDYCLDVAAGRVKQPTSQGDIFRSI